jgi:diaminopimelate decarboxylase
LKAGVLPERIVFSGVGKKPDEVQEALAAGIKGLHVESEHEMAMLNRIAMGMGGIANIALRVNPDVDARTHPKIATGLSENKFGIPVGDISRLIETLRDLPALQLKGLSMHIGSQITRLDVFQQAAQKIAHMAKNLLADGIPLEYLDFGGGLGVTYSDETPPSPSEWGDALRRAVGELPLGLVVEPGRSLVAEAGVLISRVLGIKQTPAKTFVIIDAGMNDLIRPMLYDAYHPIRPVRRRDGPEVNVTIVGPICETTDTFARDRAMALPQAGDLIAIMGAGAYGMSMASTYNSRPRPAEVMIDEKGDSLMIRARETITDLMREERLLP